MKILVKRNLIHDHRPHHGLLVIAHIRYFIIKITDCLTPWLAGDGYCQDETNTAECSYDGGDCCLLTINSEHCTECICHHQENCGAEFFHPLVGDGYCQDETNNGACNYDGGDCCLPNTNSDQCTECICQHQETCAAGFIPYLVGDGYCQDETNNLDCNYDGGDCCGACSVNPEHCTECVCQEGGEPTVDLSCK